MADLSIKLFGIPEVRREGKLIVFPYKKVNAMVYYLAINGTLTRDHIAGLLWPDVDDNVARKNLRNTIYQARKTVGLDFIQSPKQSLLLLNPDLDIDCDARVFSEDPDHHLDLYTGEFLKGFSLSDSENYDYWTLKMRRFYEDKYISCVYNQLETAVNEERYDQVEEKIRQLIAMDEYDERNVRLLMRFYSQTGRTSEVIDTYYNLKKLLQEELGVSPDASTRALYEQAIDKIELSSHRQPGKSEFFYGRHQGLARIHKNMNLVQEGKAQSLWIEGEAGIGKTALVRKALEDKPDDLLVLQTVCYQAEQKYALHPFGVMMQKLGALLEKQGVDLPTFWQPTMKKLFPSLDESFHDLLLPENQPDINDNQLIQVVVDALQMLASRKAVLVCFEDLQWMDNLSLQLLTSVILRLDPPVRVFFILTARKEGQVNRLDSALAELKRQKRIEKISLNRFDKRESFEFIEEALPGQVDQKGKDFVYQESEGNPFFLSEYVQLLQSSDLDQMMTNQMMDSMKSRFAFLTKSERDLLNIISCFYDEALLSLLTELTGRKELDIIGLLEPLEAQDLVKENPHSQDIGISFTHVKLREYIYMTQQPSKRRMLHRRIAQILEENAGQSKSPYLYTKLTYHYTQAGDHYKSIAYELEALNYYLSFSHELFPILKNHELVESKEVYMSREDIHALFAKLEDRFQDLAKEEPGLDLSRLEMQFYYMKGRYLIRDGVYREGLNDINMAISLARTLGDKDYQLEGYKQIIFYYIQTNQSQEMADYIEKALDLAVQCNYHKEIGILLRLKGLYHIMIGDYESAETMLQESIQTFQVTREVASRYAINIAAAYNYIGEIRFQQGRFSEAVQAYDTALDLTRNKKAFSSMSIFYINKGKALYASGRYEESKAELDQAYALYGQFDSFWKRPVLDAYMALDQMQLGDYEGAIASIRHAMDLGDSLQDPRALGTVDFAIHQLLESLPRKMSKEKLAPFLEGGSQFYKKKALDLLDPYRDHFELSTLDE